MSLVVIDFKLCPPKVQSVINRVGIYWFWIFSKNYEKVTINIESIKSNSKIEKSFQFIKSKNNLTESIIVINIVELSF